MLFAHGDVASVLLCAPNGLSLSKHRDVGAMANGEVRLLPERALADYSDFDARDTVYALDPFHQPRVTRTRRYTLNEHIVAPMADARTTAAKLSAHFRTALADELRSFVVFGSLPRGEFIPGVSDLNILVLLESLTTPKLVRAAPLLQQWIRQGNTPPCLYSWAEWAGMQDTFALEIADMNDAREVLWGEDPVAVDAVTYANLRRQTEREIRDTLMHLRLRLMVATSGPTDVGALLLSGFPSFTAYMRAALRLAGEQPGLETRPVIERAAALFGADPTPFLTCFDARRTTPDLAVPLTDPMVDRYMAFVSALLQYVDQLPGDQPRSDAYALSSRGLVSA